MSRKPTEPTDRPILFRDDMVQAILDGRKTVTRRVGLTWVGVQPGTRLWVREAWNVGEWVSGDGYQVWFEPCYPIPRARPSDAEVVYRADGSMPCMADLPPPWRPSIHMPRWACRLELEVVSVTGQYARGCDRSGASMCMCGWSGCTPLPDLDDAEAQREGFADRAAFLDAWRAMHPDHRGPVYRVEFRRLAGGGS